MRNRFLKIISLLLIVAVLLPVSAGAAEAQGFSDVAANAWYAEAVSWAVEHGVTKGTAADTFSPDRVCTRAQIVTFLYRAAGSPEITVQEDVRFSDVPATAYYADAVRWAQAEGITVGTGEHTFSPDASCTRAQIVTFLFRASGSPAAGEERMHFTDVRSGAYYAGAVQWALERGITRGTSADRFSPDKSCTRAEAVTFLYRSTLEQSVPPADGRVLVAYFSATGNTRPLAEAVARLLHADLYEIVPAEPYTEADLAYYTDCRADREQADPASRPAIGSGPVDMSQYDTVVIGHPIWHGQAPRIISTFLESYDFAGKTVTSFCTSHSSPLGTSAENLKKLVPESVTWLASRRFAAGAGEAALAQWLTELGLLPEAPAEKELQLFINGTAVEVAWEENESVEALRAMVRQAPLTIAMTPYGGFEQVGPIGSALPRNDTRITTEPGDIVLYSGDQIVVFYGSNTWAYTRLGKLQSYDREALTALLGNGAVTLTLTVE